MTQGFHTYSVDWEPDKITWYFDGQETFETPTTASMNQPMYVVLSTHSGLPGSWPGSPDPSLVSQMKVDYVHVYDANPYTSGGALTNSTDSANSSPATTASGTTTTGPSPIAASTPPASPTTVSPSDQTTTSNNTTVVNIGSDTLSATPSSDVFVFNGSDHATQIQDFAPDSDKLDFEMTAQLANAANLDIIVLILAVGHVVEWHIGDF
jgi:beta-glucanase (GH16 family)